MRRETLDGDRVFVIHDFMSADDCRREVERSEAIGYETFNIEGEVFPDIRSNARVIDDNPQLAEELWEAAAPHLPRIDGIAPSALNPRFRYYRYRGTESFKPHYDGSTSVDGRSSKLTFMVYLADVAFGGETRFYGEGLKPRFEVQPALGKALVFDHCLLHEGVAVDDGTKYVLRTDVIYG